MNNTNVNGKHNSAFAGSWYNGLSKLEYFTAMAMQGMLSNCSKWTNTDLATEWISNAAIKFATKTLEKLEALNK
jgi:hypothetical protein